MEREFRGRSREATGYARKDKIDDSGETGRNCWRTTLSEGEMRLIIRNRGGFLPGAWAFHPR